jgi:hypothetical protein
MGMARRRFALLDRSVKPGTGVRPSGRPLGAAVLVLVSSGLTLLVAEIILQLTATYLLGSGRIYQTDAELGWRNRPHLEQALRNPDGGWYRFSTGAGGWRGASCFDPEAELRVLVLGDSFAVGAGVELEERFDRRIARLEPNWSFVNLGVSGYGTDQQLLAAVPFQASLRPGDVVLLLTYGNDFFDILRRKMNGRAKPWFELHDGNLVGHPPQIGAREWLRDRSYLAARGFALLEPEAPVEGPPQRAGDLWAALVLEAQRDMAARRVRLAVAHHGIGLFGDEVSRQHLRAAVERVCAAETVRCLDLDPPLQSAPELAFLSDRHWNAEGHRRVAEALRVFLRAWVEEALAANRVTEGGASVAWLPPCTRTSRSPRQEHGRRGDSPWGSGAPSSRGHRAPGRAPRSRRRGEHCWREPIASDLSSGCCA